MTNDDFSQTVQQIGAQERGYLLKRAEDHRQLAEESAEPGARSLHIRFQQLYLKRANGDLGGTFEPDVPAKIPGTRPPIEG